MSIFIEDLSILMSYVNSTYMFMPFNVNYALCYPWFYAFQCHLCALMLPYRIYVF